MLGWPDQEWAYIPYQEGRIIVHRARHTLLGLDGKLMNYLVECSPGIATLDRIAERLYDEQHEPEWLQSEISHRICRLKKCLHGGPIQIVTVRRKLELHSWPRLLGWRLDGYREIPVSELWKDKQ